MPVEFFTGFEGCGSNGDVRSFFDAIYSYSPTVGNVIYNATEGFEGGKCIRIYGSHSSVSSRVYATKNCTPALTKTAGFHVRRIGSINYFHSTHDRAVVAFMGPNIGIYYHDGSFKIYRGSTEIATHAVAISTGLHHIEVKVEIDDTAGYVGIKLDGTLVYENSALNTGTADITGVRVSRSDTTHHAGGDARVYDNLFIADDWQGELKSHLLLPTADDAVEFTPSAGSDNYALLQSNDGDTSYVESDVVDEQDMYEFGPDLGMFEVHAVSIVAVARKTDVGARDLQTVVEYDGVAYDLESFNLPTSYPSGVGTVQMQCLDEAPNAAEWSPILINSMLAGFKVA